MATHTGVRLRQLSCSPVDSLWIICEPAARGSSTRAPSLSHVYRCLFEQANESCTLACALPLMIQPGQWPTSMRRLPVATYVIELAQNKMTPNGSKKR
eukprot:1194674-Prorocentrum_minimum.AAC.9